MSLSAKSDNYILPRSSGISSTSVDKRFKVKQDDLLVYRCSSAAIVESNC
jgi:hypothetical protein